MLFTINKCIRISIVEESILHTTCLYLAKQGSNFLNELNINTDGTKQRHITCTALMENFICVLHPIARVIVLL
jgi:hypothetical protein